MADWLSTGASLLGAYLGSKGNDTKTTSQNTIDPRMGSYIYGNGSNVQGVLPAATDWYQKNPSGLNEQSVQGLNRQWNVANDPNTAQGYTNMQSLGSSLMGSGVAGNPFTSGRASLNSGNLGLGAGTAQPQFQNPASLDGGRPSYAGPLSNAGPFTQPTSLWQPQTPQAALSNWAQGPSNWNGGYSGSGGGGLLGADGGSSFGGINGNGMPGEGGGFTSEDAIGFAMNNPGTVSNIAGGLLGPVGSLLARLGIMGAGYGAAPATGQINNFGSRNDAQTNAAIGRSMGGYSGSNTSGGGGDSSRGSQSSNGGRNGGDSGGF